MQKERRRVENEDTRGKFNSNACLPEYQPAFFTVIKMTYDQVFAPLVTGFRKKTLTIDKYHADTKGNILPVHMRFAENSLYTFTWGVETEVEEKPKLCFNIIMLLHVFNGLLVPLCNGWKFCLQDAATKPTANGGKTWKSKDKQDTLSLGDGKLILVEKNQQ